MTRLLAQVTATVRTVGRGELPDLQKGLGPLGGVLTALASTESGRNLIVAVDLPLLTVKFLNYFKERSVLTTHALTVCRIESKIPLCIAANPVVRSSLEAYLDSGQRSVHGFIEQVPAEVITADALTSAGISTMIFRNLNSQEDYRAALDCAEATDT
jgi:molybdopterin-guanine dinucleotide biosynthesis protein A